MLNTGFLPGGLPRRTPFLKKCTRLRGVFSKKGSELHFIKSGLIRRYVFSFFLSSFSESIFSLMPFDRSANPFFRKNPFSCKESLCRTLVGDACKPDTARDSGGGKHPKILKYTPQNPHVFFCWVFLSIFDYLKILKS